MNGPVRGYDRRMRALRSGRLLLTVALIAFVAVGVPTLVAPRVESLVDSVAVIGQGVIRAVDATMADSADTRTGRSERHAPRNHDLPLLLPLGLLALALAFLGPADDRSFGASAVARLRNSIGRRAPPLALAGR
jgi:hypothetical protein